MAAAVPASLVLDRFVSASSAEDAHTSLQRILEALQTNTQQQQQQQDEANSTTMAPEDIWSDPEILAALRHVLRTGNHKHYDTEVPVEEGASLVCKIFLEMVEQEPKTPLLDKEDSLVESLIDVISNDHATATDDPDAVATPMYTRILALQLLTKLCLKRPSKAQAQLLKAPNGLHRLGDLLNVNQEEIIRNEALLLAPVIAEWPSCAKIWMFSEVADQVMLLALEEGGLTRGNLLVQDCLDLLFNLWKHDPNNLADLVFQSPVLANNLPRLLDLRQGTEFLNPPKKKEVVKKDDDLDDILKSASSKDSESKQDEVVVPKLTDAEEKVLSKTLDILALLLESDSLKKSVWSQHLGLCSLIWELALVSPPPPQVPFVCAVPSAALQQKALETTSLYFHDPTTMERHAGLDRLLYLVCTGGLGSNLKERMGISQAALHVIRSTISHETANEMLMNTLAPPISMDEDGESRNQPPPPTVIHKLLNTVAENLTATQGIDPERRKIFLAGALGGLSIFLTDQTSREVLLRITTRTSNAGAPEEDEEDGPEESTSNTSSNLVESMLHALGDLEEVQNPENTFLSMTLLRFLCHWTVETPSVVQTILSSNQSSIVLSALFGIKTKKQSHKQGVAVLGKLLMGLCMEYMGDEEEKCGGWTRSSIMDYIAKKSGGVSKYTSSLEQFKTVREFGDAMPWSVCDLEFKVWSQWYTDSVLLVRKRVVQELTGSGEGEEEDDDDDSPGHGSEKESATSGSARSLQKLVFQQSQEIDELQQNLRKANALVESQQSEISTYKRRVESAPSQLDTMLTEMSTKTSELDRKVTTLEEEKVSIEDKHKDELKSRDDRIAALLKELEESQARERESRDETETLREEINSLSQAYTSLEQEYRQQQQMQSVSGTTSEQQPGDQGQEGPHEQPHAANNSGGSTTVSALRSENERLRSDAQAADQWMAMAVEKIKGLTEQNAILQTELTNLRQSQSNSMNEQQQQLQQQYHALFEENQSRVQQQHQLQAQLDNASKDTQQLQQVLNQEREKYSELQQQLYQSQEELQTTVASLEDSKSKSSTMEADFERKVATLESDLQSATEELSRLREELSKEPVHMGAGDSSEVLKAQMASKNAELKELQQALDAQNSQFSAEKASLQREMETARAELEKSRQHEQEEMYKRESRIRELEARINRSNGPASDGYPEEDIKARDEEISELRAANEAAQDWISQAVEHHRSLSERHAAVTAENASLTSQVRELRAKVSENDGLVSKAYVLEQESSMQASQLREAQSALAASEDEVKRMREELSQTQYQANNVAGSNDELEKLREQVSSMDASLREHAATCEQLRGELRAESSSKDEALEELLSLKNEMKQLGEEASSLREEVQVLRAQGNDSTAEEEQKVSELYTQLQSMKEAKSELERLHKDDKNAIERLEAEVAVFKSEKQNGNQPVEIATQGSSAQDVFGSGPAVSAAAEATRAHELFGTGPTRVQPVQAPGAQEVFGGSASSSAFAGTPEVSAHDVFGSGPPASQAPTAHDVFGSGPPAGQAASAHDVFGSGPATVTAHDVFGSGPSSQVATAQDVFGSSSQTSAGGEAVASPTAITRQDSQAQPVETGDLSKELAEKNEVIQELESKLNSMTVELDEAKAKMAGEDGAIHDLEDRIQFSELTIKDLEKQLSDQKEDANNIIAQWQSSYNALEVKNAELMQSLERNQEQTASSLAEGQAELFTSLQAELDATKTELAEAKAKLDDDAGVVSKWEERVQELESTIKDLEQQLNDQEEEANNVISQWQSSCNELEQKNAELLQSQEGAGGTEYEGEDSTSTVQLELKETKAALAEAQAKLDDAENVVVKWEERVTELQTTVSDMEGQLNEQEEAANTVIAKWQESCTALEEKNAELLRTLESSNVSQEGQAEDSQDGSPELVASLQAKLKEAEGALAEARNKLSEESDVVLRWQERVEELDGTVKDLKEQLREQEEEANNVIAKWQETCTSLEEKNSALMQSLDTGSTNQSTGVDLESFSRLQNELSDAKAALEKAQKNESVDEGALREWETKAKELEASVVELQQTLSSQEEAAKSTIAQWQESYNALEASNNELQQSLDDALASQRTTVQDLEENLQAQKEEADGIIAQWEESYNGLKAKNVELGHSLEDMAQKEAEIKELEQKLRGQEEEATQTIATWQESYSALEAKNKELEKSAEGASSNQEAAVKDLEEKLQAQKEEADGIIAQWEESYNSMKAKKFELEQSLQDMAQKEAEIKELEQKLSSQEEEATQTIAKWQESYNALEAKNKELGDSVEGTSTKHEAAVKDLEGKLQAQKEEADGIIAQWEESYNGMKAKNVELEQSLEDMAQKEAELKELEQKLSDQEEEATQTIATWQESYSALEAKNKELEQALEDTTAEKSENGSSIASLQAQLSDSEHSLAEAREKLKDAESMASASNAKATELEAKISELESQLSDQEAAANDVAEKWQESYKALEGENTELSESLEKAESRVMELESLRESVESLQLKLTDSEAKIAEDERTVLEWQNRVHELEQAVQDLEQQLSDQENEANDVISKWQELNTSLEKEKTELQESLDAAMNRSKELTDETDSLASSSQAQLAEAKASLSEAQKSVAEKESENADLSQALEEANRKIELLGEDEEAMKKQLEDLKQTDRPSEEDLALLQSRLDESESSLSEARENLSEAEKSLRDTEDKVTQLEESVKNLEDQLMAKDHDLATSIAEWQEHCNSLERQATELSEALENARSVRSENRSGTEHEKDLEDRIEELERELAETESEAADVVANWQESYQALEARNNETIVESEALSEEVRSLKEVNFSLTEELNQYKDLEAEARNEVSNLNTQLESLGDEINKEWEAKVEDLNLKVASMESNSRQASGDDVSDPADHLSLEELETLLSLKDQEMAELTAQLEQLTSERDEAVAALKRPKETENAEQGTGDVIESSWSDELDDIEIDELDEAAGATINDDKGVAELNAKVQSLQEEVDKLTKERDEATEALESVQKAAETLTREQEITQNETDDIASEWAERTRELETTIQDLEEQLESQSTDATEAIASWDSRCSELEQSLNEKHQELESRQAELSTVLKDELAFKSTLLASYDEAYEASLDVGDEAHLDDLRARLSDLNANLETVFSNWSAEVKNLQEQLLNEKEADRTATENAQTQSSNEESLKDRIAELEKQISENESMSLSNEESLKNRISDLEKQMSENESTSLSNDETKRSRITELEKQLSETEATISQQQTCLTSEREIQDTLKSSNSELERSIADERAAKDSLQAQVEKLQEKLSHSSLETDFESRLEQAMTESSEYQELLKEKESLELSVSELKDVVRELEDELREANDSLQIYVTQEVSDKATEVASQALRRQLDDIRRQAHNDRTAFEAEREARLSAQQEVDRLRTDLHALVDISEQEKALYGPDALTLKAGEKVHRKERSEITELRKSLSRAVDELREARASERDAEERASKAALHISVCEEELSSAKSDLHYLVQTMDEMRENEASRRASLENRISALENELDVLRRFHSAETDKLRGELNQVTMEKERIFQSLKDSEKTNTGLVFAASREYPVHTDQSPEAELIKLRIEKAQLLIASSEEGIRTERRLREVVATELSSAEADVLVERERRLASEAAVKNMQLLVGELQDDARARQEDILRGNSSIKLGIEQENDRLKIDIERLSEENSSLRLKLDAADSAQENSNYKIEKLKEECRMAQAKLHRLDREARFNNDVQTEMTRLRVSPKKQNGDVAIREDPAQDKQDEVGELYEKVQQQTAAIRKEREMYRELEAEHEDLLALLAEQEETKKCLISSLQQLGGQDAVESAIRDGKENVSSNYYIRSPGSQ